MWIEYGSGSIDILFKDKLLMSIYHPMLEISLDFYKSYRSLDYVAADGVKIETARISECLYNPAIVGTLVDNW